MTELEKYIQSFFGVTREEAHKIGAWFRPITLKKGDYYLHAGRYSDRMGFVQSGILREYFETGEKEVTKWISTKGYFALDLSSFLFDKTARWNIQALVDTEMSVIDKKTTVSLAR